MFKIILFLKEMKKCNNYSKWQDPVNYQVTIEGPKKFLPEPVFAFYWIISKFEVKLRCVTSMRGWGGWGGWGGRGWGKMVSPDLFQNLGKSPLTYGKNGEVRFGEVSKEFTSCQTSQIFVFYIIIFSNVFSKIRWMKGLTFYKISQIFLFLK